MIMRIFACLESHPLKAQQLLAAFELGYGKPELLHLAPFSKLG